VTRHLLPQLQAMNFVLDDVLDGGVNDSLNLDSHGKALSFHLLSLPVDPPRRSAGPQRWPLQGPWPGRVQLRSRRPGLPPGRVMTAAARCPRTPAAAVSPGSARSAL
jgi:hypothetical protein